MAVVKLNAAEWKTSDDFYAALLEALDAPEWHGRNLDALSDSLSGDDINGVRQPIRFIVTGIDEMEPPAKVVTERFLALVAELKSVGHDLDVAYEGAPN